MEFREDQSSCEALYQSVLQANEVRAQEQAKADQERRGRESLTSLSGKNSIKHKTDAME